MTIDIAVHKLMCGAPMSTPLGLTWAVSKHFIVDNSVDEGVNCQCAAHKGEHRTRSVR